MGRGRIKSWVELIQYVVKSQKNFLLVVYEDLVQEPIREMRKIMKFLEEKNGFKHHNLEERLLCLSENIQGTHKRSKKKLTVDPYSDEMKEKLNNEIISAEKIFIDAGIKIDFSFYKREK